MFKTQLFLLILIFSALQESYYSRFIKCPRPKPGPICTEIFNPVCGWIKDRSKNSIEFKNFSNECFACSDPQVSRYLKGNCDKQTQVTKFWENWWNRRKNCTRRRTSCGTTKVPVCGHFENCDEDPCFQDYDNSCLACKDEKVEYYKNGFCPIDEEKQLCPSDRPTECDDFYEPVCGNINVLCVTTPCPPQKQTFFNHCKACMNELVDFTSKGECIINEQKSCPPMRPIICTEQFQPVCGQYPDNRCKFPPCTRTFDNNCFACREPDVFQFLDGKCQNEDEIGVFCSDPRPEQCIQIYDPVCGLYGPNINCLVAPCGQTFFNECFACANSMVEFVKEGECQNDNGEKLCPQERPDACTEEFQPVCGLFGDDNDCLDPPCTKTFGNRCKACEDERVVRFIEGECKDEDIFKVFCVDPRPTVCPDVHDPVCGFWDDSIQCVTFPCGQTFSNGCDACANSQVEFYVGGECEDL